MSDQNVNNLAYIIADIHSALILQGQCHENTKTFGDFPFNGQELVIFM